ncbi:MAG: hypothetical protein Q7O66_20035, partial [Dehalococcoidia bacterium]|nr:hypothetical protein [Dehalococcoidia bacterium]
AFAGARGEDPQGVLGSGQPSAQGSTVQSGEILLVRTGWLRVFEEDRYLFNQGEPALMLPRCPG